MYSNQQSFNLSIMQHDRRSTAEAIIGYLESINSTIDFGGCVRVIDCN